MVQITTITDVNKVLFENLIPETIFDQLGDPGYFGIGAIGEDDKGKFSAGVLIFSIEEGSNGEENLIAASINWIYVAEEFRRKTAGDTLMKEFFRIMEDSGIEHILCDIPMPEEYDLLCAFLEEWGFTFTLANLYEMTIELGEIISNPLIGDHKPSENTMPLKVVSENYFKQLATQLKQKPDVIYNLSSDLNDYDMDLSCVFMSDKNIEGIMLVKSLPSGELEVLLMRAFSNIGKAMSNMMLYAAHSAAKKYSLDTRVRLVCRIDATASVLEKLFPDMQPLLVRRGYFSNAPYLSEREV